MTLSETEKLKIEEEKKYRQAVAASISGRERNQYKSKKNKLFAALLAIFLGGFGIHKFYLGRVGWGIIYLIFSWTWIPMFVGIIEGIVYLCMEEDSFHAKYS